MMTIHATPTYITEELHLFTYILPFQMTVKVMAYTALAYSHWVHFYNTHINAKAAPTNNTNYSSHTKAIEFV